MITDYFNNNTQDVEPKTIANPTTIIINKSKKLLTDNLIDMGDYNLIKKLVDFKGIITNACLYFGIIDKLKLIGENSDVELIIINFEILFSHLHNIIIDKKINKDILVASITNYNENKFIFTNDQQQAIFDIFGFMYSNDINKWGLNGLPGSGKTITITKLVHFMLGNNYLKNIVFVASTNKAVNVIKAKFRNDLDNLVKTKINYTIKDDDTFDDILDKLEKNGLKIDFLTIHKLLGYKNDYDEGGERVFVRGQGGSLDKYEMVIIDEISMINFDIVYSIFDITQNKNVKVLFVGDEGQLTPVKETISIIFAKYEQDFKKELFVNAFRNNRHIDVNLLKDQIDHKYALFKTQVLVLQYSTLNTVMRCNNDSVIMLCNELRKKIFDNKYVPQFFKFKSDKVFFYKYDNKKIKTDGIWFKKFVSYLKSPDVNKCNSLALTWTNNQSNEYNNNMRKLLFNKDVLDKFEVGDILVLLDFYNMKDPNKNNDKNNDDRFYSAEQIKVIEIEHVIKVVPMFLENLDTKQKINGMLDIKEKYLRNIKAMNRLTKRSYRVWKLHVKKLFVDGKQTNNNTSYIYVVSDEDMEIWNADKKIVSDKILELITYYKGAHREHYNTIDEAIIKKLWKEYNNKFIDTFARVNMSYSMTTHKSQGSTFHNVFVDMVDILKNNSKDDANRCLYTSFSRTANELHILY